MTSILNKFKSLAIGVMAVLFFVGMTLNSCTTKAADSDNVEAAAAEGEEHPEGEGEEHPEGEDEEHPEGEGEHLAGTDHADTSDPGHVGWRLWRLLYVWRVSE